MTAVEKLDCATFIKAGWHCQIVRAGDTPATYISTPIVLVGSKPLDFYLIPSGKEIEFTDDGMTLFALRTLGFALEDKRNWRGLENIAIRHGFSLSERGAIESRFPEDDLDIWAGKILRLFATIANWEEDRLAEGDTDFILTREVEMLLRAKNPNLRLDKDVEIKFGKKAATFNFLWGDTYIDAIRPRAQTVNARLRKALLVGREDDNIKMLFIVDDRQQPEKAEDEISILAGVGKAIRLTDFEKYYNAAIH